MNLLKNSIELKISKCDNARDKIKAVLLIQVKAIVKYESVLSMIFSQMYGTESRNKICRDAVAEYIDVVQAIIDEGIEKGEIKKCNSRFSAYTIFSFTSVIMMYKKPKEYSIEELYNECELAIFNQI